MANLLYKKKNGKEYYEEVNSRQMYATNSFGQEIYIENNGIQEYALNENKTPYYAKKTNRDEYYAKQNNVEFFITIGQEEKYAKKLDGSEIYIKDLNHHDVAAKINGIPYYAKDSNNSETYPKRADGTEYKINNKFATTHTGDIILPKKFNGVPIYETNNTGDEIYPLKSTGEPIFGTDLLGNQVYAKTQTLDEYYPMFAGKLQFAKNSNNLFKYAVSSQGIIIYPTENNEEYYITDKNGSYDIIKNSVGFGRYAIRGTKEIYPTQFINGKMAEKIILLYAHDTVTKEPYYPLDSACNEYTTDDILFIDKVGYPITTDGYVIVPNKDNKPKFIQNDTNITQKNISSLLYRPDWNGYDYLTKIKSSRKPFQPSLTYQTLEFCTSNTGIFYFLIGILMLVITTLLYALFR